VSRPARTITLVDVRDPEVMADQIAGVLGGRDAAIRFLERALAWLRGDT
jgi:hypothetical protein